MMRVMRVVAACVLLLGTAGEAAAQSASAGVRQPAVRELDIMVTVSTHAGPPLILRRVADAPRNVVLVNPAHTTAQQLSDAIRALLLLEATDPEGSSRNDRAARSPAFTTEVPRYPWAEAMLERLRHGARLPRTEAGGSWSEGVRLPIPPLVRP